VQEEEQPDPDLLHLQLVEEQEVFQVQERMLPVLMCWYGLSA
jgi:hypothetical protein